MVVIPQEVDRLVAGPVVVAQEWMEARQDPADGMETTAGVIPPGVDLVMVSFEDADRPGMVHFAAVPETHQDLLAEAIAVMVTGALNNAVRMIVALKTAASKTAVRVNAVMETVALKTAVMETAVLMIGVSIQSALKTAVMVTVARVTGVLKDGALKSAGMAISALRGVVLMTGVSQTVVLELVASVMARPAASAPDVASVETVR